MGRKRVKHDLETKRDKYVVNVSYSFYCYFTFSEASVSLGTYFPLYLEKISLGWMRGRRERGKEGRKEGKKKGNKLHRSLNSYICSNIRKAYQKCFL